MEWNNENAFANDPMQAGQFSVMNEKHILHGGKTFHRDHLSHCPIQGIGDTEGKMALDSQAFFSSTDHR